MESQRIDGGKILITGGSGVLGQYITDLLKQEFNDIVVADIVKPEINNNNNVKFVKVDLREPFSISEDFEVCIHLAAYVGGIQFFTKHPVENIRDNPKMTANALDAAVNSKLDHVIFTSSSVVYQHQTEFPTNEESVLRSPPPSSAYGMSKLVGEYLCKAYNEQFGLKYTILRPFNIYGPEESPDPNYAHVIPELARKVLSGQFPVEIYGSGDQTRTFTHGRDVAQAYHLTIKNKNALNETFNVSGNEEIKIIDVLRLIWNMAGHTEELKVKHLPPLPHDVQRRFPSNRKIFEKLGWQPNIPFKDGLQETIEWIRDNPKFDFGSKE
jgi:nucleoside-diphosphate-sugar epimerase